MTKKNKKSFNQNSNKKKFSFFDNIKKKTKLEIKKQTFSRKFNIFCKKNKSLFKKKRSITQNKYYKYSLAYKYRHFLKKKEPKNGRLSKNSYRTHKLRKSVFFKKPRFKEINYPFPFHFKLLNEALVNK